MCWSRFETERRHVSFRAGTQPSQVVSNCKRQNSKLEIYMSRAFRTSLEQKLRIVRLFEHYSFITSSTDTSNSTSVGVQTRVEEYRGSSFSQTVYCMYCLNLSFLIRSNLLLELFLKPIIRVGFNIASNFLYQFKAFFIHLGNIENHCKIRGSS